MRARVTSAAGIERERAIEASCDCSASLNVNSTFGRPIGMLVSLVSLIPTSYANIVQLTTEQHTSRAQTGVGNRGHVEDAPPGAGRRGYHCRLGSALFFGRTPLQRHRAGGFERQRGPICG